MMCVEVCTIYIKKCKKKKTKVESCLPIKKQVYKVVK